MNVQYHKQLFRHDPENGFFGDCQRTVFACILDKKPEEIPNFGIHVNNVPGWHRAIDEYLATQGLQQFEVPYSSDSVESFLYFLGEQYKDTVLTLSGKSKNGTNHVVLVNNGKIIHDPAIDNSGIIGPCDDGYFWVGVLITSKHTMKDY